MNAQDVASEKYFEIILNAKCVVTYGYDMQKFSDYWESNQPKSAALKKQASIKTDVIKKEESTNTIEVIETKEDKKKKSSKKSKISKLPSKCQRKIIYGYA